jgi:hypothetical protein
METPLFKHDCENCVFLGSYKNKDLYSCSQGNEINTVIFRNSSNDFDYASGLSSAMLYGSEEVESQTGEILFEALKRATKLGLKPKRCYL